MTQLDEGRAAMEPVRLCACGNQMVLVGQVWKCATDQCNSIRFNAPTPPRSPRGPRGELL